MYFLYLAQCEDGSIYTGITNDLARRLQEHKDKKGGNYTQSHAVMHFAYTEKFPNKSDVLKRECETKKWTKERKIAFINKGKESDVLEKERIMQTKRKTKTIWDVVVIGGGPAGMMAAGRAAERGKSVVLLEKNASLGKKLLITGGGRCNFTNNKPDTRTMLSHYKGSDQFLFSAFSQFNVKSTLDFFDRRGMAVKEEEEGRMFPVSDTAQSVLDVLELYMKEGGVRMQMGAEVASISIDAKTKYIHVRLNDATEVVGRSCVVATGGVSHPETGSTGDGFAWLKKLKHSIADTSSSLVPIALTDAWAKKLSGVTLTDIKLTAFQNNKKQGMKKGKLLFTHFGISGPTVLNMSKMIGELLEQGDVVVMLDLFPKLEHDVLKQRLQALFIEESNKKIKNTLDALVPSALVSPLLALAWIDGETANHSVKKEERTKLLLLLKAVPLHVKGLLGTDKAIVSSGGVDLTEVDFKTMRSRVVPNIYIVGDALNIDRPSGGYSLQICWTTGFVAGSHC